jgi:RNA polymerase sigma factor (sigma-70 family)
LEPLSATDAAQLYAKYGFFLLRRCRAILRDAAAAEDALQQTFERLLRKGGDVMRADDPLRWLYRVVDRACFDVLRGRRRSLESRDDPEVDDAPCPGVDHEMRDAVLKLLGTLGEQEMQIAVLLFVDGLTQGEIAAETGVSRVTVNKRVQALRALADRALDRTTT